MRFNFLLSDIPETTEILLKVHRMLQSLFPKWRNHSFQGRLPFHVIYMGLKLKVKIIFLNFFKLLVYSFKNYTYLQMFLNKRDYPQKVGVF